MGVGGRKAVVGAIEKRGQWGKVILATTVRKKDGGRRLHEEADTGILRVRGG